MKMNENNKICDSEIYQVNKSIDIFNCLAFQLSYSNSINLKRFI